MHIWKREEKWQTCSNTCVLKYWSYQRERCNICFSPKSGLQQSLKYLGKSKKQIGEIWLVEHVQYLDTIKVACTGIYFQSKQVFWCSNFTAIKVQTMLNSCGRDFKRFNFLWEDNFFEMSDERHFKVFVGEICNHEKRAHCALHKILVWRFLVKCYINTKFLCV